MRVDQVVPGERRRAAADALAPFLGGRVVARLEDVDASADAVLAYAPLQGEASAPVFVVGTAGLPPVVDTGRLATAAPDLGTAHHLDVTLGGPLVVSLDGFSERVVAGYHALVTYTDPSAHLVLVGESPDRGWRRALDAFVRELNLSRAWVAADATPGEEIAFVRRAAAAVSTGPDVLELFGAGVPVVTWAGAVADDVVDGASLVLPDDAGPELVAEALARVVGDRGLAEYLGEAGRRRAAAFTPDVVARRLLDAMAV